MRVRELPSSDADSLRGLRGQVFDREQILRATTLASMTRDL